MNNLKSELFEIIEIYKKCKIRLLQNDNSKINSRYFRNVSPENAILIVDTICSLLNQDERKIIKNNFIDIKTKKWWIDYYARSTYFRIQGVAISKFMNYIGAPI